MGIEAGGDITLLNNTVANVSAGWGSNPTPGGAGGIGGQHGGGGAAAADGSPGFNGLGVSPAFAAGIRISPNLLQHLSHGSQQFVERYILVNNIVAIVPVGQQAAAVGTVSYGIVAFNPVTATLDYNDVYGWDKTYELVAGGPHDVSEDPEFVDVNIGDFHLLKDSPSIDEGTSTYPSLTLPKDDLDGARRPQGDSHDMGAYEYGTGRAKVYLPCVRH